MPVLIELLNMLDAPLVLGEPAVILPLPCMREQIPFVDRLNLFCSQLKPRIKKLTLLRRVIAGFVLLVSGWRLVYDISNDRIVVVWRPFVDLCFQILANPAGVFELELRARVEVSLGIRSGLFFI